MPAPEEKDSKRVRMRAKRTEAMESALPARAVAAIKGEGEIHLTVSDLIAFHLADLAVCLLAVSVASNHIIVVDLVVGPLAVDIASNHIIAVDLAVGPLAVDVASNHIIAVDLVVHPFVVVVVNIAVYLSICLATTPAPVRWNIYYFPTMHIFIGTSTL
uniref:Uncharacterized protein n=1 Tax=Ananas comosus var. bracteatus TaxID=296719 RepID=A0A6V7Q6V6_ANACO|nr:unnamed protein product [Ananas comosus var. bracteatus]